MESCDSHELHRVESAPKLKCLCSLTRTLSWKRRHELRLEQAHSMWKENQPQGGTTTCQGIHSKIFHCNFFAAIGGDTEGSYIFKGCFWKRLYARDVQAQNHLHVYSACVGGFSHLSSQRRCELGKPRLFVTTLNVSHQVVGSSSDQVQKILGSSTIETNQNAESGHPVIRATTIYEQGNLRQTRGRRNIHFNASEQSLSMMCKPD